jgi:hypothetical protein
MNKVVLLRSAQGEADPRTGEGVTGLTPNTKPIR